MAKRMLALMALMTLSACDYAERHELRAERGDGQYREAMDDYRAGRIDAALAGFEKAVANDPANASARFQLACLQQDAKKRYLDAYCGYREYLLQHPDSDKARLAKDRMALCEKEVARELANRYGLLGADDKVREIELVRGELKAVRDRLASAEKSHAEAQARVQSLSAERERLLAIVKGDADAGELAAARPSAKEAKDLLDEGDADELASARPSDREVKGLLSEGMPTGGVRVSDDLVRLKAEADEDLASGASPFSVSRQAGGGKPAADLLRRKPSADKEKPTAPARPKSYTVQEGDTLYGIAKRFYGDLSAWKRIRDANKAQITTDGRVRVGDKIELP